MHQFHVNLPITLSSDGRISITSLPDLTLSQREALLFLLVTQEAKKVFGQDLAVNGRVSDGAGMPVTLLCKEIDLDVQFIDGKFVFSKLELD